AYRLGCAVPAVRPPPPPTHRSIIGPPVHPGARNGVPVGLVGQQDRANRQPWGDLHDPRTLRPPGHPHSRLTGDTLWQSLLTRTCRAFPGLTSTRPGTPAASGR